MVSDWQYFRNQTLYAFDHLIVSYDTRFTEVPTFVLALLFQSADSFSWTPKS